ncbi:MAG TPA: hypothetical protein VGU74_04465 [Gemmatimonadales bacterium]|nr:hypothetical protein [Gemmatimonadales bacterium]
MKRAGRLVLGFVAVAATALDAQQSIAARLSGRASAEIVALVQELGRSAASQGLPVDPLIQKAIEGNAKGVPAERVASAVRLVFAQLDTAAAALRSATHNSPADTVEIAAGGFAITAGLRGRDIAELARTGRPAADVTVGLRVAGTLAALGVPPAETVALVSASLRAGQAPGDLLALPGSVQSEMARGATPAQAAAGLARAAAAQARHGPPADHGLPPHPPAPPHP